MVTTSPKTKRRILVQKFGGTSVGSVARIHHVATLALAEQRAGNDVVVVVSAMSGETNRLLALADEVADGLGKKERDTLAAAGEQASAALTAIAIQAAGGKSRCFLGHQIRILTDKNFGDARIQKVESDKLKESLARGEIPVVAGFQGIDEEGNITTLGRGGSDTTAVAVAAALGADCDIYTDVDGVYTADPNIVPSARKLVRVPYQHMLTFAALGAKVLHDRCIEVAKEFGVHVQVRTSFGDTPGTTIVPDEKTSSKTLVGGCACDKKLVHVYGRPSADSQAMSALRTALSNKAVACSDVFDDAQGGTSFTLRPTEMSSVNTLLQSGEFPILCLEPIAKVSLVGTHLNKDARVEAKAKGLLNGFGIAIKNQLTSEASMSFFVAPEDADNAMRTLHDGMAIGVKEGYDGKNSKPLRRRI